MPEPKVIERFKAKTKVVMVWEVDADYEVTEGGITQISALANAGETMEQCLKSDPKSVMFEKVDA